MTPTDAPSLRFRHSIRFVLMFALSVFALSIADSTIQVVEFSLLTLGSVLNGVVIFANGGRMPVIGRPPGPHRDWWCGAEPHHRFLVLCDRIRGPLGTRLSLGDLALFSAVACWAWRMFA